MPKRKFNYTLLTSREAAIELDVSPDLVNTLARTHRIPACKVGRQWRFKKRDITFFKKDMGKQLQAA
jgi:excisionase family DNA binding protein